MSKPSKQEIEDARKRVRPFVRKGRTLYTLTEYTKGQTDYVRVFVVVSGEIREITFEVGKIIEARLANDGKRYGIAMGGGGYSKSLHVLDGLFRRFERKFDQSDWRQL